MKQIQTDLKRRSWNRKKNKKGMTVRPLILGCLSQCLFEIWQTSHDSSRGSGHPQMWFVGVCCYRPCWADLRRVLSPPALRHQPGHHHNTPHACTLSEETHSSNPHEEVRCYQWSDQFMWNYSIIMQWEDKPMQSRQTLKQFCVSDGGGRWWQIHACHTTSMKSFGNMFYHSKI